MSGGVKEVNGGAAPSRVDKNENGWVNYGEGAKGCIWFKGMQKKFGGWIKEQERRKEKREKRQ